MPVIIGMDPHKRSAAIEVINEFGDMLRTGKFGTDEVGYAEMLAAGRRFGDRVWAVEGCNGVGRLIAHRLVHDGETVLDVPAKLSAQVRVFATGNGRKTDSVDAHSVALVALRTPNLVRVQAALSWSCWACSSIAVTSSAVPGPRPSTASTGYCWSSFLAEQRSSCPRRSPARSCRRSNRATAVPQ
ncbi:transposase [Amycolatopsis sp. NPDC049688]|uniref:IS110 family transposase n=1 Tax=Amycolatopsis sp. NPDC049688 TaxID=3154733 RepID=UPI0034348131